MSKHVNILWACKKIGNYPQAYVKTIDAKYIQISYHEIEGIDGIGIVITRRLARLLVKRINQCLETTR